MSLLLACAGPAVSPEPALPVDGEARLLSPPTSQPARTNLPVAPINGFLVHPGYLPAGPDFDKWAQSLSKRGINLVLLDAGSRDESPHEPQSGQVYFRTSLAPTQRDLFSELVPVAHQNGLSVFARLSLRRINWIDPDLGWGDRSFDAVRRQLRPSSHWDLFHPAFQEYLVGLLTDLVKTGVDGVLFQSDALGPWDGFSPFALRGFEQDFHVQVDPAALVPRIAPDLFHVTEPHAPAPASSYPAAFWQWTGWKARESLKVMKRLKQAMLKQAPALRCVLEIHSEAVTDPASALAQFGEDLLEAKRNGFELFLTPAPPKGPHQALSASAFVERMARQLGGAERVWLFLPAVASDSDPPELFTIAADRQQWGEVIGLIYVGN
jgi:hypothetical protein